MATIRLQFIRPHHDTGRKRVRFVEPTVTEIDNERADLVRMQDIEEAIAHFQAQRAARRERREGRVPTVPYATLNSSPTHPPSPAYLEVPTYIIEPISSLKDLDPGGTALGSPSASPLMASMTAAWDGYSILDSACSSDASAVLYLSDASTATEATPRLPYNEPSQDLEVPRLAFSFESDAEIVISPLQFEFNTHLAPFPAENAPATDMTLSLPPFSPFEAKAFSALSVGLADHCGSLATAAFGYTPASSNAAPLTSTPRLFPTSRSPAAKPRAMSMLQLPAMTRDEGLTYAEILDWSVYDRPLSLLVSECSAYTADADLTATIAPGGLSVPQARSASPKPSPSRAFGRDLSNQRTTPVRGVKASHKPGRANLRSQPPSPLAYPRAVNIGAEDLDNGDFATKYELLLAGLQSPALGTHDGSRALSEYAPQERSEYDIRISAVLGELQCAYEHLSMREWDENQFRRVFA